MKKLSVPQKGLLTIACIITAGLITAATMDNKNRETICFTSPYPDKVKEFIETKSKEGYTYKDGFSQSISTSVASVAEKQRDVKGDIIIVMEK